MAKKKTSKSPKKKLDKAKKSAKKPKISFPGNAWTVAAVVVIVFILALYLFISEREQKLEKAEEKALVKINGELLTQEHLDEQYAQLPSQYQLSVTKEDFLEAMIIQKVLLLEAEEQDISVSEKEINELIESQAAQAKMEVSQFMQLQTSRGVSEEQIKQVVREKLIIDKLIKKVTKGVEVSDDSVKEFYDSNPEMFTAPEQAHARHILVETEEQAYEIKKQLDAGADFAELAKNKSIDPSAAVNGGDLGFFPKGRMVPEFENATFGLEINETSNPVKSQFGWHIIQLVEEKEAGLIPLEEIKNQLKDQMLAEAQKSVALSYLEQLKSKYKIEKFN